MNIEAVVYLLRKTSLTRDEIGKLTSSQANEILKELYFQELVEEYKNQYSVASLLAAIYNTIPRKSGKAYSPKTFLNTEMPTRDHKVDLEELAEKKGIKLPHG